MLKFLLLITHFLCNVFKGTHVLLKPASMLTVDDLGLLFLSLFEEMSCLFSYA